MGYKTYHVLEVDRLCMRSSTDGYQPKFLVDNGFNFLKSQCVIGRTLRDDWRVEDIASRICEQLGFYAVVQHPCNIRMTTLAGPVVDRRGVVSTNFSVNGSQFISFRTLMQVKNVDIGQGYTKLSAVNKLHQLIEVTADCSGIPIDAMRRYYHSMVTADLLVLNQDRHFKNFGVLDDLCTGQFSVAPLFDFGMGLFENDTMFDDLQDLDDCLRYSYLEPFGEDPFELFDMLVTESSYRSFLRSLPLSRLQLPKYLFVHPASYAYFRRMRQCMLEAQRL